jgi:hypothetical protein
MESQIYSTNSNEAVLKDSGPFKIRIADQSIKGQKTFGTVRATEQIIVGQQIKIESNSVMTQYHKIEIFK